MGLRATRLLLPHLIVPQSPSSSQTLASAISSPSSTRRTHLGVGPLLCRYPRSSPFRSPRIRRLAAFELPPPRRSRTIARSSSSSPDSFPDEEFSREIQELALQFQLSTDNESADRGSNSDTVTTGQEWETVLNKVSLRMDYAEPNWPDGVIPASTESVPIQGSSGPPASSPPSPSS